MSNKRITDLTELTTPTTDDVLPIVDIATNTTQKVQVGNLPTTTAVTNALATKQDTLVSGTNIKTVNSTSLLGSGNVAVQETLVSGTNIKTINSTSLLGSGNITIAANPSGVSGAIQFSDGSAFASDASNLFWNNTTKRLGVGTNNPLFTQQILAPNNSTISQFATAQSGLKIVDCTSLFGAVGFGIYTSTTATPSTTNYMIQSVVDRYLRFNSEYVDLVNLGTIVLHTEQGNVVIGNGGAAPLAKLQVKGSGSTSATTSLLVQNSAGTAALTILDSGAATFTGSVTVGILFSNQIGITSLNSQGNAFTVMQTNNTTGAARFFQNVSIGKTTDPVASAALEVVSTTRGFLPPVMTTTQKNAIATPAAGLVVYDTTTNKLCCYNGSTWNDLF